MNKRTQLFICFLAVFAAVGLALHVAPTQAHYVTQAKWQEAYAPVFVSDLLSADSATYCVNGQRPTEDMTLPVTVHFQFCHARTAEGTEERELHLSAVSSHAAVSASELPTYILPGDQRIFVIIPLTVHPVDRPVLASVTLYADCEGESLQATIQIPVYPVSDESQEQSQLFTMPEAQTYGAGQPVLVTFRSMTAAGWLTNSGSLFPAGTRYSTDGVTFVTLWEDAAIPLQVGQSHVTLQLPDADLSTLSLRLDMGSQWDSCTLFAAAVSGEIDQSRTILPTGELSLYVPCLRIMDNSNVSAQAEISVLSLVQTPAPDDEEEAEAAEQMTLQYVPLEDECPFTLVWDERDELCGQRLHVYPVSQAAQENEPEAQPSEVDEDAGEDVEDIISAPAGSYLLTIRWKLGGMVVHTETIEFFVQR